MYYNTTAQTSISLRQAIQQCNKQDEAILLIFKRIGSHLSPSQVFNIYNTNTLGTETPLTSIRRSITNLTTDRKLIKTESQRAGIYGRPEYLWKLTTPIGSQSKLF